MLDMLFSSPTFRTALGNIAKIGPILFCCAAVIPSYLAAPIRPFTWFRTLLCSLNLGGTDHISTVLPPPGLASYEIE